MIEEFGQLLLHSLDGRMQVELTKVFYHEIAANKLSVVIPVSAIEEVGDECALRSGDKRLLSSFLPHNQKRRGRREDTNRLSPLLKEHSSLHRRYEATRRTPVNGG